MSISTDSQRATRRIRPSLLTRQNTRLACQVWAASSEQLASLKRLTQEFKLSVVAGDLKLLDGNWYVTHAGLLRLARRYRCAGIQVQLVPELSEPSQARWVFRAAVYTGGGSQEFVGYGDANPSNVSPAVRGAEMRVAETRAVNRALRKAYGIGLCSVEELGSSSVRPERTDEIKPHRFPAASGNGNGTTTVQPNLRDRLCVLIRKHELDPAQVKKYAADFCGTETLRDASRDLVQSFITTLEEQATHNRGALICRLNSYAVEQEAHS